MSPFSTFIPLSKKKEGAYSKGTNLLLSRRKKEKKGGRETRKPESIYTIILSYQRKRER